jgi:hypothetical protein
MKLHNRKPHNSCLSRNIIKAKEDDMGGNVTGVEEREVQRQQHFE